MPKIYIETDMTELPKKCNECSKFIDKGVGYCNAQLCWANYYADTRPEWCPLKQGMLVDDDELSIGGTGINE